MTAKYYGIAAFADYVGLKPSTVRNYFVKNMLPEPDIMLVTLQGESVGWSIDSIEHWMNNRPGRGHTYEAMRANQK